MQPVSYIFVERKGSASAAAAVSLVVDRLTAELSPQVMLAANRAREEATTACQAELEAKTAETEILVKQLKELEEKEARRAADSARVAELAEKEIRDLKAKLERERECSQSLEAKADAMIEARRGASHKATLLARSLRRAQIRMKIVVDKHEKAMKEPCSSSTLTWDENDVMELEGCIGELNAELAELRKEARSSAGEYSRNKAAVSNFRDKYEELSDLKAQVKAMRAEIDGLKAELEEARATPLPGRKVPLFDIRRDTTRRGAPFPPYFENVIAPAMLNTGATPEQINEIIRKETISCANQKINLFMSAPTFNRAL
jgi:chromosome segregation ATPase